MKKIISICLLAVLVSATSFAQEIKWVTLDQALALQKKKPKKIMIDVYTSWCGPCKMLDKNTFHNKDVVAYVNANYYAVKFNAEGNEVVNYKGKTYKNTGFDPSKTNTRNSAHELTYQFQVNAYPTIVFMDEKADVIAPIKGYQTAPQLELYLKMFKSDKYLELTTQEKFNEYYKAFKPEFKE